MSQNAAAPNGSGMPVRGDRTCPVFDPTQPRGVLRYFEDLEMLFLRYGVTDSTQKKRFAVRYPPTTTEDAWRSLPAFDDATASYEQFRAEVLKLYPGTDRDHAWTTADIDVLVGKRARLGPVKSYDEYLSHYVEALPPLRYLLKTQRLTQDTAARVLTSALPRELEPLLTSLLVSKFPEVHPNDPYSIDQLHEAISYVLRRGSPTLHDGGGATATWEEARTAAASISAPLALPQIKTEPSAEVFQQILNKLENLERQQAQVQSQAARGQGPYRPRTPPAGDRGGQDFGPRPGCWYCGRQACNTRYCQEVQDDIRAGKIRRNHQGRIVLASGEEIPDNPRGSLIRERVNVYYDTHPAPQTGGAAAQMVLELSEAYDPYDEMPELEAYGLEDEREVAQNPVAHAARRQPNRQVMDGSTIQPKTLTQRRVESCGQDLKYCLVVNLDILTWNPVVFTTNLAIVLVIFRDVRDGRS